MGLIEDHCLNITEATKKSISRKFSLIRLFFFGRKVTILLTILVALSFSLLVVSIAFPRVIPGLPILGFNFIHTNGWLAISLMLLTFLVPLYGPLYRRSLDEKRTNATNAVLRKYEEKISLFEKWVHPDNFDFKHMMTISITIITGTLIFLTVANINQEIVFRGIFDTTSVKSEALIKSFAALTIIPFAISSILFIVLGPSFNGQPDLNSEGKKLLPDDQKSVMDGIKVAMLYMICGFLWLILTVGIFLYMSAVPLNPIFSSVPTNITSIASSLQGNPINYSIPIVIDDTGNIIPKCEPEPGRTFAINATRVYCEAVDSEGNTANASFFVNVIDKEPDTRIIYRLVDGNNIAFGNKTESKNIDFSFYGEDNIRVLSYTCTLYYNNIQLESVPCDKNISYDEETVSKPGRYKFEVSAIDAMGVTDPTPDRFVWDVINSSK